MTASTLRHNRTTIPGNCALIHSTDRRIRRKPSEKEERLTRSTSFLRSCCRTEKAPAWPTVMQHDRSKSGTIRCFDGIVSAVVVVVVDVNNLFNF